METKQEQIQTANKGGAIKIKQPLHKQMTCVYIRGPSYDNLETNP